jgi:hypothetical protein
MWKDKIFGKSEGCCCGTKIVGLRQVHIGDNWVGIAGMNEVFEEFYKNGKTPEESTGDELVEVLRKDNFIPDGSESIYKSAFLREYQRFYEARKN